MDTAENISAVDYSRGMMLSIHAALYLEDHGKWENLDAIWLLHERQIYVLDAMQAAERP